LLLKNVKEVKREGTESGSKLQYIELFYTNVTVISLSGNPFILIVIPK
jgi:hypothetical protein